MKYFSHDVRPQTLSEVVGQKHLMPFFNKVKETKILPSLILYGEPGIGKTSLAFAILNDLKIDYSYFNAVSHKKSDLEEMMKISEAIIIDEIHRLNKDKQDILTMAIERGKIKVIATTTENPFLSVIPAVRSRMHILELKSLSVNDISEGLEKIILKFKVPIKINKEYLQIIAQQSNGDYRYALNIIDLLSDFFPNIKISKKELKIVMPSIHFYSDKKGDGHYDLVSAFHKSLAGSDVDASLYYLARLVLSNDFEGLKRRLAMVSYEDVGLASPNVALRTFVAIELANRIGLPDAMPILAHAVIDICFAPKSNSAMKAIDKASKILEEGGFFEIPLHLKDSHFRGAEKLAKGVEYKYPHEYGGKVDQQYLPNELIKTQIYVKNPNDKV